MKVYDCLEKEISDCAKKTTDKQIQYWCQCFEKMRRIYVKVEETEMLTYIRKILNPFFPLAVEYFCKQINAYKDAVKNQANLNAEQIPAMDIYEDTRKSVLSLSEAVEFVIQTSNKADRMVIQSVPINSGLLYSAPKMSAYYSEMLNELASILQNNQKVKYAFCVFPSIQYRSEAKVLFLTRQEPGKIALIRIPSVDLLQVNHIRIWLVHELFHVVLIPESARRKERANYYLKILLHDIGGKLFTGIRELEQTKRECLEKLVFKTVTDEVISVLSKKTEGDRIFYSRQIQAFFASELLQGVTGVMNLRHTDIYNCLYQKEPSNFQEFEDCMASCEEINQKLAENALELLNNSTILEVSDLYMRIFREVLSDLSTIWTLRPKPDTWFESFQYHTDDPNDRIKTPTQYMRIALVILTLVQAVNYVEKENSDDYNYLEKWVQFKDNLLNPTSPDGFRDGIKDYIEVFFEEQESIKAQGNIDPDKIKVLEYKAIYDYYAEFFLQGFKSIILFETKEKAKFEAFKDSYCVKDHSGTDEEENFAIIEHLAKRRWEKA